MSRGQIRYPHRHRYWQGQRLRSRDLNALLTDGAELRYWHNRALHDAYGIIEGLEVRPWPHTRAAAAQTVLERSSDVHASNRALVVESGSGLRDGDRITLEQGVREDATILRAGANRRILILEAALSRVFARGTTVRLPQDGATELRVADTSGFSVGTPIHITQGQLSEETTVAGVDAVQGRLTLADPLQRRYGGSERIEVGGFEGVEVAPGQAYDCFGRRLIVQRPRTVRFPPPPDVGPIAQAVPVPRPPQWTLLLRPGACDRAELVWRRGWIGFRDGVALARGSYPFGSSGFRLEPERARPQARPLARPHVGSGATIHGQTRWQTWDYGAQVTVDTSAGGYQSTPCYFPSLRGPLIVELPQRKLHDELDNGYVLIFPHVHRPGPTQFTLRIWAAGVQGMFRVTDDEFLEFARGRLSVFWIGIEMLGGQE